MSDTPSEEATERPSDAAAPERLDEDGIPLDRKPTLDDVRGEGSGRTIAVGCTVVVLGAVALFWLLRAGVLG